MNWFVLVLWHINHCRLFNAKSGLYIYIRYIWIGLFWFYGISTIVGYLMLNTVYTYILDIYMICKHKSTKLNSSKYCNVSLTIQLNINHLFIQLNDQRVLFLTIQFSMSHLFALSSNVKQFYLTHWEDIIGTW